jgi:hypothetical protein
MKLNETEKMAIFLAIIAGTLLYNTLLWKRMADSYPRNNNK